MEERLTVRVGANIREFERKMASMQGQMDKVGKGMQSVGSNMTKWITAPALGLAAAGAGITAAFGWKRLVGLDSAQAQLKGLGYEIKDVERISDQVNNAVQGTTMTMAEGTSVAAGALAAGIDEGEELEAYIKAVGNAAVGSGREVGEMASIFNRVQGSGKLMTQELNMIEDGMPGFAQAMADNLGVGMEEFRKMVTAGEVTSEDFLTVMDDFAGDMSEAYADSWQGMVANTKAWVGILGENLLSGVFEQSKDSIGEFMELLKSDAAQEWATEMGAKISDGFGRIINAVKSVVNWWNELSGTTQKVIGVLAGLAVAAGPVLLVVGKMITFVGGIMTALAPLLASITKAGGLLKWLAPLFGALTSPITLTIAGIAALGAGFVLAYNKSETFRNFVDGIKDKFVQAIEWIGQFKDGIIGLFQDDGMSGIDILTSIGISQEMADKLWEFTGHFIEFYHNVKEWIDKVKTTISGIFEMFKGNTDGAIDLLRSIGMSDETIETIYGYVGSIQRTFYEMKFKIQEALAGVKDFFVGVFEDVKAWWDADGALIFDAMGTLVENVFEGIKIAVGFALEFVKDLFERFAPIVQGIWGVLWPTIQFLVETVWEKIKLVIGVAMDLIQGIISGVSAIIEGDWTRFGEIISETASSIWTRVTEFFTFMKDRALELFNQLTGGAVDKFIELRDSVIEKVLSLVERAVMEWEKFKVLTEIKIRTMVNNVKVFFEDLWLSVTTKVTEIKDAVVNKFTELKDGAILKITEMYNSITTWFSDLWTGVTTKATEIKDGVVGSFTGLKDDAIARVTTMYNSVSGWFTDLKTDAVNKATGMKDDVVGKFSSMRDDSNQKMKDMYDWVTGKFGDLASWIDTKATGIKDDTVQAFVWMKDGVVDGVQTMYDDTTTLFDDVKSFASDTFDNMVEGAKELPGRIGDAIKNAASFAVDGVKSLGNKMGSKLGEVVDGVTGGLNGILEKIGISDLIPNISIPGFSTGTRNGAIANDTLGMVNDRGPGNGVGGATQELIKRDGQIFAPRGRNAIVPLKKGDEIFNGAQTQSLMSSGAIPRFSQGTGADGGDSGKKGLLGTLKDVVSNVWGYIQDPGKAFSALMDSVTANFDGMDGFAGKMLSGGWSMLTNGIKNFITKMFKENEGALGSGKAGNWMNYRMTTPYSPNAPVPGYPRDFNNGHHYGVDYGTPLGTPITATTGGQLSSFWNEGGGKIAKLVTGELRQFFMHMQTVAPNGSVGAGDVIGKSGNSGRWTTGPHVHWQAQQGSDALNTNTIDPRKVVGHANGGIFSNQHVANFAEDGPEAIIPLSAKRRGRANSLYDSVGKAIGADDGSKEMIRNQQIQIDRLDTAINVLLGIEDKTGITESDIGRANDKYNARQTSKRGATTGRFNYV